MTLAAPVAAPSDLVEVGRVVDAWGVKGWVRVEPYNSPEQSILLRVRQWWLKASLSGPALPVRFSGCRVHGDALVAKPVSCEERDAALAFKASSILLSRSQFPEPAPGECYWVDLIGCSVLTLHGERLGEIEKVEEHGAHPVLTVRDAEVVRLIPFVEPILSSTDIAARRVVVDWGLDY